MDNILEEIKKERERAANFGNADVDATNTKNDWIAYINAYTGRAAEKVFRNQREQQTFRENMIKAAGLCISAIEAYDKGYC